MYLDEAQTNEQLARAYAFASGRRNGIVNDDKWKEELYKKRGSPFVDYSTLCPFKSLSVADQRETQKCIDQEDKRLWARHYDDALDYLKQNMSD